MQEQMVQQPYSATKRRASKKQSLEKPVQPDGVQETDVTTETLQTANPHRAGQYSGIHPEDLPVQSDTQTQRGIELAAQQRPATTRSSIPRQPHPDYLMHITEEHTFFQPRVGSSAKRVQQGGQQYPQPVQMRVRAGVMQTETQSSMQGAPLRQRQTTAIAPPQRSRFHKLVYVGGAVFILFFMLLGAYLALTLPQAFTRLNDDRVFGFPRKQETFQNVGHGGTSDFIAENRDGTIKVSEELVVTGNQNPKPHLYIITTLPGPDAKYFPVTLSFVPSKLPGKLDMLVTINGFTIREYNNGTTFQDHP